MNEQLEVGCLFTFIYVYLRLYNIAIYKPFIYVYLYNGFCSSLINSFTYLKFRWSNNAATSSRVGLSGPLQRDLYFTTSN